MARYIDAEHLFKCETCRHHRSGGCDTWCENGECYSPDMSKIPTADVVPINEVYRLIAGHSDYHGDNILSALTCVTEGKEVKPIIPLTDVAEVVRCKDCKHFMEYSEEYQRKVEGADGDCYLRFVCSIDKQFQAVCCNDFCSYGERKMSKWQVKQDLL